MLPLTPLDTHQRPTAYARRGSPKLDGVGVHNDAASSASQLSDASAGNRGQDQRRHTSGTGVKSVRFSDSSGDPA